MDWKLKFNPVNVFIWFLHFPPPFIPTPPPLPPDWHKWNPDGYFNCNLSYPGKPELPSCQPALIDPIKLVVYASSSTALHEKKNSGAQGRSLHFLHKSYPRNRGGVMRDEIKMLWNIGEYIFLVSSMHLCLHYQGLRYITQYVLPVKYNLGREISKWHFSRIWPAYIEMQAEGFLVAKQGMVSAASIVLSNSALTPKLQISLSQMRALWLKRSI